MPASGLLGHCTQVVQTHTYTYINICTHTYINCIYTHTHMCVRVLCCLSILVHTYMHTYMQMSIFKFLYVCGECGGIHVCGNIAGGTWAQRTEEGVKCPSIVLCPMLEGLSLNLELPGLWLDLRQASIGNTLAIWNSTWFELGAYPSSSPYLCLKCL